jgi:tetratricopeptide (TPR) repeat protein
VKTTSRRPEAAWPTPGYPRRVTAVGAAVCLLAAALSGGCAAHRAASDRRLVDYLAEIREVAVARPPTAAGATLERSDPGLAAAQLRLAVAQTADHHRQVAEAYARLGVRDLAYYHFAAAVRLNSADAYAYEGLARIWRDWGFPQRGLSDAHRAVFYAPGVAVMQNTLGTILLRLGQPAAARASFERALVLEPDAGYVVSNLCYMDVAQARTSHAVDACKTAVTMRPRSKATRNNLALAYAAAGDFDSAEAEFSATGGPAEAAYNLGIAYMIEQQLEEAAAAFRTARRADPAYPLAIERLRQVQAMLDRRR